MNSNFRRHTNRLQFAASLRWIIVIAFLGAAGLSYLYLTRQLHVLCVQRKTMEQDLRDLVSENSVLGSRIYQLTSITALQRQVDTGYLKLVPMNDHAIAHVHGQDSTRWAAADVRGDQYQTVAHETTAHR